MKQLTASALALTALWGASFAVAGPKEDRQAKRDAAATTTAEPKTSSEDGIAVSKLVGAYVYHSQTPDDAVATIDDLVMQADGKILYVVANPGVGYGLVAIPVAALKAQCSTEDGMRTCHVSVPMTTEQLGKAPVLKTEDRTEFTNQNWVENNNAFFQVDTAVALPAANQLVCYSHVNDVSVRASDNEAFGELDDVVVCPVTHQAKFAILGHGGALSIGESYTAVPFTAVKASKDADGNVVLSVNASQTDLQSIPQVTASEYAELKNPATQSAISKIFPEEMSKMQAKDSEQSSTDSEQSSAKKSKKRNAE